MQWHDNTQQHTTHGHHDLETESAHRADSVKMGEGGLPMLDENTDDPKIHL